MFPYSQAYHYGFICFKLLFSACFTLGFDFWSLDLKSQIGVSWIGSCGTVWVWLWIINSQQENGKELEVLSILVPHPGMRQNEEEKMFQTILEF